MRFDKHPHRVEPYRWTPRKLAMAASKPERQRRKEQERLPLLADQIPPAPAFDLEAEQAAREAAHVRSIQTMRDIDAKHWRHGRALYFAADEATRARIRADWMAWKGPAKPGYFIYVVEVATGAYEARMREGRERDRALRRRIAEELAAEAAAQGRLCL
ncbi:TPA: hypothetical protein VDU83_006754 [Pseudomonas aeruginosa]|nr:hypothetical protein [Pseudomonas aeruginosa]